EDFDQAARLKPKDPSVLEGRSFALRSRADYRVGRGESPLKELETMEGLAEAYLKDKPLPPDVWINIALLWADQALYRGALSEDPTSDFVRADEAFKKVDESFGASLHASWARVRVQHARLRVK